MKVDIFSDFMTVDLETTCLVLVIFITLSAAGEDPYSCKTEIVPKKRHFTTLYS